ncbi:MAG: hypothetical protein ACM3VV_05970 [Deltaproteobacteria bacterium]
MNLKIKDIKFHLTEEEGKQYAIVRITDGKTRARTIPLFHSFPYLKEWIQQEHPTGSNPDSWLFVTIGKKQHCSKLSHQGLVNRYDYYKKKYFPNLFANPSIPAPDKSWIKNMLTKPWNLYIFRHSSLTEKSKMVTEAVLRKHAGWTMSSEMPQIYIHLQDESSNIILEKYGFKNSKNSQQELSNVLKARECPNCNEPNKPDGKFCIKCKMILSYDSYTETLEKQKQKDNDIEELKRSVSFLTDRFNAFLASQPGNTIIYDSNENNANNGIVKGIELKPEINNIAIGEVVIPSTFTNNSRSNNKKK